MMNEGAHSLSRESSDSLLSEWVLSRKISLRSMTRHFAAWKKREFILDRNQAVLTIKSAEGTVVVVVLQSLALSVGRHEYAGDTYHWLWLKYYDDDEKCPKEIVMRFETKERFLLWEKELLNIIKKYSDELDKNSKQLLLALMDFLLEKEQTEIIEQKEDQPQSGQYFWNDEDRTPAGLLGGGGGESLLLSQSDLSLSSCSFDKTHEEDPDLTKMQHAVYRYDNMKIRIPSLNILILAVGTRGDIQPFVELALVFRSHGHQVRLATHESFRSFVTCQGLDYYPLAGDPVVLSEFMVKTQGCIIPTSPELIKETPKYRGMMLDILYSCWDACTKPDPCRPESRIFAPDAIISNPVTYGHIHCAEALGVPLHLMFPQPWTPTKAFPHPLSCLSYSQGWCSENYLSYQVVDRLLWLSIERETNEFRKNVLGLEPIRVGQSGWNILNYHQVPFVKMWSPSLAPKPKDWPSYVDVVGTFFPRHSISAQQKTGQSVVEQPFTPSPEVEKFLSSSCKPIVYVGFGSMVLRDMEGVIELFLEAAALLNVRIIVQIGWSNLDPEQFLSIANKAQQRAQVVLETEEFNSSRSLIFPSPVTKNVDISESQSAKQANGASLGSWLLDALSFAPKLSMAGDNLQNSVSATEVKEELHDWTEVDINSCNSTNNDSETFRVDSESASSSIQRWSALKDALFMGPCPHDWLFGQVNAVVHHGGAGTTAMGLRCGLPTWICPFFGDQFFWGEQVHSRGLGVKPYSVQSLNLDIVVNSMEQLLFNEDIRKACTTIQEVLLKEDGVQGAVDAFYRHLPLQNMLCDVSLFQPLDKDEVLQPELAQVYCEQCRLKMSLKTFCELHELAEEHIQGHSCIPCVYMNYTLHEATSAAEGLMLGVGGVVHEVLEGLVDVTADPLQELCANGLLGGTTAFASGVQKLLARQIDGGNLFYRRLLEGLRAQQQRLPLGRSNQATKHRLLNQASNDSPFHNVADGSSNKVYSSMRKARGIDELNSTHSLQSSAQSDEVKAIRVLRMNIRAMSTPHSSPFVEGHLSNSSREKEEVRQEGDQEIVEQSAPFVFPSVTEEAYQTFAAQQHELTFWNGFDGDVYPSLLSPTAPTLVDDEISGGDRNNHVPTWDDGFEKDCAAVPEREEREPSPNFAFAFASLDAPKETDTLGLLAPTKQEPPLRTTDSIEKIAESPLLGSFYLRYSNGIETKPTKQEASREKVTSISDVLVSPKQKVPLFVPKQENQAVEGQIKGKEMLLAAFKQAQDATKVFRRLNGELSRWMPEPRFFHLAFESIARDDLQKQFFSSCSSNLSERQQVAVILTLFRSLTQHRLISSSSSSYTTDPSPTIHFVDFCLLLQCLRP